MKNKGKKIVIAAIVLSFLFTGTVFAQTHNDGLRAIIASLLLQIQALQAKILSIQLGKSPSSSAQKSPPTAIPPVQPPTDTNNKTTNPPTYILKVLSPNGGETWTKGSQQTFTFTNGSGNAANIYLKPYFACRYSRPACMIAEPMPYAIAVNAKNAVTIKIDKDLSGRDIPAGQYFAMVEDTISKQTDESDAPFDIKE